MAKASASKTIPKAKATKIESKPGSKKSTAASKPPKGSWESRAVMRLIEAGSMAECPHCNERVKFRARHRDQQVICNIYEDGVWRKVEQYHEQCYLDIKEPYGEAQKRS